MPILRLGNELTYYPGEANLRMADVAVINKIDTADLPATQQLRGPIRGANPGAVIVEGASPVTADHPDLVTGRKVLVVEDGPTLTHGNALPQEQHDAEQNAAQGGLAL